MAVKCSMFKKSVKFLGHIVSAEGVSVDPEKSRQDSQLAISSNSEAALFVFGYGWVHEETYQGLRAHCSPVAAVVAQGCAVYLD